MKRIALDILKKVAEEGEISLAAAIRLSPLSNGDHRDQYPLALLVEDEYLGMTIGHTPPAGLERMREFALATTLHMFRLPKDTNGDVHYNGITSTGSIDPEDEKVFLKAKGALYLDEYSQKFWDRLWSFVLGFSAGLLASIGAAWLRGHFKLP